METCPISYHVHDCDCRRDPNTGRWAIDPDCRTKHNRITRSPVQLAIENARQAQLKHERRIPVQLELGELD